MQTEINATVPTNRAVERATAVNASHTIGPVMSSLHAYSRMMWKERTIGRFVDLFKSTATKPEFLEETNRVKLIVGLGNPGRTYADSRHNVGFRCLNKFARNNGIEFSKRRSKARLGFGQVGDVAIILAKPQTFMNLSGESVAPLARYYKIEFTDILIVYDDVDLPLGRIRIREKGGPAGHNGMKSIIRHLGAKEFPRIRVGIKPLESDDTFDFTPETRTPDFVLGRFAPSEKTIIEDVIPKVAEAIHCVLIEGIPNAMNKYNIK